MLSTTAAELAASGTPAGSLVFHGPDRAKPLAGAPGWAWTGLATPVPATDTSSSTTTARSAHMESAPSKTVAARVRTGRTAAGSCSWGFVVAAGAPVKLSARHGARPARKT